MRLRTGTRRPCASPGAGEATLLEEIPLHATRVLDVGAGDGRLLGLVLRARPHARGVALDFSPAMLQRLTERFASDARVDIIAHDCEHPLPAPGCDAVVSSFAVHHLPHERKRRLYEEIWAVLDPGGVFCNLEHVASPTPARASPLPDGDGHHARRKSVEQVAGCRDPVVVASRDRLCGSRLLLEVAGTGAAYGPQRCRNVAKAPQRLTRKRDVTGGMMAAGGPSPSIRW
jgi:SAM-dependent methyltransferase